MPRNGNGSGARPRAIDEYNARKRRRRFFNILKLLFVMALLGGGAGFGIRYWPQIRAYVGWQQSARTTPPKEAPPAKKIGVVVPPVEPPKKVQVVVPPVKPPEKVIEPAKVIVLDRDEQKARGLLTEGRQLLEKLDFAAASKRGQDAAALKATPKTRQEADRFAYQAAQFELATKHIQVSEFATAGMSCRLRLRGGGQMRGLVQSETAENLVLLRVSDENPAVTGTQRVTLPREEVTERVLVTLTQRQEEFRQLLANLAEGLPPAAGARASDYYDLVFLSKRLGLAQECLLYLKHAMDKAPEGAVGNVFRNLVVARALESANILAIAGKRIQAEGALNELVQRTLPGYEPARDAADAFRMDVLSKITDGYRSTLTLVKRGAGSAGVAAAQKSSSTARELADGASSSQGGGADEVIQVDSSGVTATGGATALVEKANQLYEQGLDYYRQYRQGTKGNNNEVLAKAEQLLRQSVALYDKVLAIDKNNKAVENRQIEASMLVYACLKYRTM